jgi:hypothetical protein
MSFSRRWLRKWPLLGLSIVGVLPRFGWWLLGLVRDETAIEFAKKYREDHRGHLMQPFWTISGWAIKHPVSAVAVIALLVVAYAAIRAEIETRRIAGGSPVIVSPSSVSTSSPLVVAVFDVKTTQIFTGDETPVALENRGDEDAVNLHIDPIRWTQCEITFDDIHRQQLRARGGPYIARPLITSTDPGAVDTTRNILSALIYDAAKGAEWMGRGDRTPSWPFHITYEDLRGNRFETLATLHFNRDDRHLWIQHNLARRIAPENSNPGIISVNIGR